MKSVIPIYSLLVICQIVSISWSELLRHIDYVANDDHKVVLMDNLFGMFGVDGKLAERGSFPTPPRHMLELYRIYAGDSTPKQSFRYRDANVVRSFTNKGQADDEWQYFFELKDVFSKHEEIVGAEFRLYIDRDALGLYEDLPLFKIQLFEGLGNGTFRFLEARAANASKSGWEEFGVKSSVKRWHENPELNTGFAVKILDANGHCLPPGKVLQNDKEPVLIVYSKNPKIGKFASREGREDSVSDEADLTHENAEINAEQKYSRSVRALSRKQVNLCKRRDFEIDFEQIGWSLWIIEPKQYNAYICKGDCVFGKNQNTTTHARMQSLVRHLGFTDATTVPSCVPTELESLSILFYDKDSNPVLARFDDMIATRCGCR